MPKCTTKAALRLCFLTTSSNFSLNPECNAITSFPYQCVKLGRNNACFGFCYRIKYWKHGWLRGWLFVDFHFHQHFHNVPWNCSQQQKILQTILYVIDSYVLYEFILYFAVSIHTPASGIIAFSWNKNEKIWYWRIGDNLMRWRSDSFAEEDMTTQNGTRTILSHFWWSSIAAIIQ